MITFQTQATIALIAREKRAALNRLATVLDVGRHAEAAQEVRR